jgi:hypothetical protein
MSSIKRTSPRTSEYKKGIADSRRHSVDDQRKSQKTRRKKKERVRLINVPMPVLRSLDIRCELDKFYEEVNAMHQQFGQQQQSTNTFGFGGGRRKRRSSKLKRRSRRSSKLKRTSRRSSKLKRRNN